MALSRLWLAIVSSINYLAMPQQLAWAGHQGNPRVASQMLLLVQNEYSLVITQTVLGQ